MAATEQELSWARAIKATALKKGVEPVSDLLYLQMAIISKDKVKKGVNRLAKLEKFRKKHNISGDAVKDDAMELMKVWYNCFPGLLGSFGRNADGQVVQVVHVKNYFPNAVSDDFWEKMPRATYYMLNLMNADVDAIRAGYVSVSDCGDMGWSNFSLKAQQMQSDIFNDAYPVRIGSVHLLDPPIMLSAMLKLVRPFLSEKVRKMVSISESSTFFKSGALPPELVPKAFGGAASDEASLKFLEEQLTLRAENERKSFL